MAGTPRQRRRHVVGVDDGYLGGSAKPLGPQHFDLAVGDREAAAEPHGADATAVSTLVAARGDDRVRRQERPQVSATQIPMPRPPPKGLVEAEVADVIPM